MDPPVRVQWPASSPPPLRECLVGKLSCDLLQADTSVSGRRQLFCSDDRTVQLSNIFGWACLYTEDGAQTVKWKLEGCNHAEDPWYHHPGQGQMKGKVEMQRARKVAAYTSDQREKKGQDWASEGQKSALVSNSLPEAHQQRLVVSLTAFQIIRDSRHWVETGWGELG